MAYKINGTTVVDNSRNVCACCVTSCCITASSRMDAPSGTTAQRPSSPATGSIYFDTDLGSLISYNGTDWGTVGGGDKVEYDNIKTASNESWAMGYVAARAGQCRGCCCGYHRDACCRCLSSFQVRSPVAQANSCVTSSQAYCCVYNSSCRPLILDRISWCARVRNLPSVECHNVKAWCNNCSLLFQVFPDGSSCFNGGKSCALGCASVNLHQGIYINKLGGTSFYNQTFDASCFCTFCFEDVPTAVPMYCGNGLNSAAPNMTTETCRITVDFARNLTDRYGYSFNNAFGHDLFYEIDSSTMGENYFNVCCRTLRKVNFCKDQCTVSSNTRAIAPGSDCFHTAEYMQSVNGKSVGACVGCCQKWIAFTYLHKNKDFDNTELCWYTKELHCDCCSGLRAVSLLDQWACCTIGYSRQLYIGAVCPTRPLSQIQCTRNIISQDGCYLFHFWLPQSCQNCMSGTFCTHCCNTTTCCCQHCCVKAPAIEKIRLCDGCFVCAVFFCGFYDCKNGNTSYPYCVLGNQTGLSANCWTFNFQPQGSCRSDQQGHYGHNHEGRGFCTRQCVVSSCNCSNWTYLIDFGCNCCTISVAAFNESTMNFDIQVGCCNFQSKCCPKWIQAIEMVYCCCCNSDARYSCLRGKVLSFLCSKGYCQACHNKGGFFTTIYGHCIVACRCADCMIPFIRPLNYCAFCICNGGCAEQTVGYVNPCTDHLVCFFSIMECNVSNTAAPAVRYIGAMCLDLRNGLCVTKVETLWPQPQDHCMYARSIGLENYCQGTWCGGLSDVNKYECRPNGCNYNNFLRVGCYQTTPLIFKTYRTKDKEEAGILVHIPNRALGQGGTNSFGCRLCSSCQRCPACVTGHGTHGWFGADCHGADICRNTCNGAQCGDGLQDSVNTSFIVSKIPYGVPLSSSPLFECVANDKEMIEMFLGCHCLAGWYKAIFECGCVYCCGCNGLKQVRTQTNYVPCYHCKHDYTCHYTLNCDICVWGHACFRCPKSWWYIYDVYNDDVCMCQCCNFTFYNYTGVSGCCFCCCCCRMTQCAPARCWISKVCRNIDHWACCTYPACAACCAEKCRRGGAQPCVIEGKQMMIYDGISDCIFRGYSKHSDYLQLGDRKICGIKYDCNPKQYLNTSYPIKIDFDEYGFRKYGTFTGKGVTALTFEWFNCAYSCYCNY